MFIGLSQSQLPIRRAIKYEKGCFNGFTSMRGTCCGFVVDHSTIGYILQQNIRRLHKQLYRTKDIRPCNSFKKMASSTPLAKIAATSSVTNVLQAQLVC
jgi:hypothetical protein